MLLMPVHVPILHTCHQKQESDRYPLTEGSGRGVPLASQRYISGGFAVVIEELSQG